MQRDKHVSSFSDGLQCVEVEDLGDGRIGISSTKGNPDFSRDEFSAFVQGVQAGEFDRFC